MSFTTNQIRKLRSKLRPEYVKTRDADGVTLSYLEGWHVVAEANRIFGFDGWDRETVSSDCVWTKQLNGRYCAAYVCRIRVRVRAGDVLITREGSGAGESNAASPGQAHEFAAKAAETDATKRALMTFGNAFGLSLYGGTTDTKAKIAQFWRLDTSSLTNDQRDPAAAAKKTPALSKEALPAAAIPDPSFLPTDPEPSQPSLPVTLPGPDWPQLDPLTEAQRLNEARQERIDKSELAISEPKRIRNSGHLAFVAARPCLICGKNRVHAHHLKFAQPTALGRKVSDEFTVPLCAAHHRELHSHGDERVWWAARGINALDVAKELWSHSGGAR